MTGRATCQAACFPRFTDMLLLAQCNTQCKAGCRWAGRRLASRGVHALALHHESTLE